MPPSPSPSPILNATTVTTARYSLLLKAVLFYNKFFLPLLVCQRYLTPVPSRQILKILRLLVLNFTTSLNNPEQFQQPTRSQWQCSDDYGFVIVKIIFTEMLDVCCMYSRKCCPYVMYIYTYMYVYIQVASDCIKWENVIIEKNPASLFGIIVNL